MKSWIDKDEGIGSLKDLWWKGIFKGKYGGVACLRWSNITWFSMKDHKTVSNDIVWIILFRIYNMIKYIVKNKY